MKKAITFIILFISACANHAPNFSPRGNKFPDGVVGKVYFAEVEITNTILFKENIGVDISPAKSGLIWKPEVITLKGGGRKERRRTIIT